MFRICRLSCYHRKAKMISRSKLRSLTIVTGTTVLAVTVLSLVCYERDLRTDYTLVEPVPISHLSLDEGDSANDATSGIVTRRRPHHNIFFLKVHKCASSTVQNILMRYGQRHELNFVLPHEGNYLGHPELLDVDEQALPLSSSGVDTSREVYNILCHHCRFSATAVSRAMPPDTVYLAIVRDPVDLFESLYSYCDLADAYHMSLEQFVSLPDSVISDLPRLYGSIGYNQMAFDFGVSAATFGDADKVADAIRALDSRFHLVMVAELFDESVVLMKNLLGFQVQDVVYFAKNKRFLDEKQNLSADLRSRIQRVNAADQMIYDHFVGVLKRKISDFGAERMKAELQELRRWNRHWYRTCGVRFSRTDVESLPADFRQITTKVQALALNDSLIRTDRAAAEFCETLAIAELPFTDRLRNKHIQKHFIWWQKIVHNIQHYVI